MKYSFLISFLLFSINIFGQKRFDSLQVEKLLMILPKQSGKSIVDQNIIKAIETTDKHYRGIADSIFGYQSKEHTILQTVLIKINDSIDINPLELEYKISFTSIIFNNESLNTKVEKIAKSLNNSERSKLYNYLKVNFDYFDIKKKKLNAQPVRIIYIKFPDDKTVQIGIDIYGSLFLWTVDKTRNWDITKVDKLWVY